MDKDVAYCLWYHIGLGDISYVRKWLDEHDIPLSIEKPSDRVIIIDFLDELSETILAGEW